MSIGKQLRVFATSVCVIAYALGICAQELQVTGTTFGQGQTPDKKQRKKTQKELARDGREWLNEVTYIITPEERRAFEQLSTNEERDQFVEIFWNNRNPDPESPVNTVKEEHYRRLAYADEHFASGVPGRQTDRGRIYIIWGPPDEIESHPAGGTWARPMSQGGGSTTTYPWELWRYRHLEGIGENVELEFVDPSGSAEYHLTNDPCEKDALTPVAGAGASLSESLGMSNRAGRFTNSNGTTCPMAIGGIPASDNEFERINRYFAVQRAPRPFKDLAGLVTSRMVANQLPFEYRADFLRATSNTVLVPITVQLRNRDLSYKSNHGLESAVLDVYGRITDVGGRVVQTFDDVITRDLPESLFPSSKETSSIYQKSVPLRSGLYRLDIVIKDTQSGNVGMLGTALRVPRFEQDKLEASSLILADRIEPVAANQLGVGQFALNSLRVRPALSREFSTTDKLGIYMQLYNLSVDEQTHKTKVSIVYRVLKDGLEVWHAVEAPEHLHQGGEQLVVERFIPVETFGVGRYTIEVTGIDLLTNQTVVRSREFTLKPATSGPNAKQQ